jgi:hypothetical protein
MWFCCDSTILSYGSLFHGAKWLPWHPHKESPTLHRMCRIVRGLSKGKQQILEVAAKRLNESCPTPLTPARTHARTCARARTHAHAHTHTHKHSSSSFTVFSCLAYSLTLMMKVTCCSKNQLTFSWLHSIISQMTEL